MKIMSDESRHSVSDVCCFLVALLKVSEGMEIVVVGGIFMVSAPPLFRGGPGDFGQILEGGT